MNAASPWVFDGHNDTILRVLRGDVSAADLAGGLPDGHIDAKRAQEGRFGGGFFAIFAPSPGNKADRYEEMVKPAYDVPLPPPLDEAVAADWVARGLDAFDALVAAGAATVCRSAAEIEADGGDTAYRGGRGHRPRPRHPGDIPPRGLRSLGPVWSRPNIFGHGVPFRFPSDPDTGPGLTEAGERLVRACNRLRIAVDLSHLNAAGFRDVARISDAPLIATHSNAHA
jgi:membrane dipeptidase